MTTLTLFYFSYRECMKKKDDDMTENELQNKLDSVGRKVFVECFSIFKFCISKEDCIEKLMQKYSNKTESGCDICCSNAKLIFKSNMECRAIGVICDNWGATKLSDETIEQAMALLQDCP